MHSGGAARVGGRVGGGRSACTAAGSMQRGLWCLCQRPPSPPARAPAALCCESSGRRRRRCRAMAELSGAGRRAPPTLCSTESIQLPSQSRVYPHVFLDVAAQLLVSLGQFPHLPGGGGGRSHKGSRVGAGPRGAGAQPAAHSRLGPAGPWLRRRGGCPWAAPGSSWRRPPTHRVVVVQVPLLGRRLHRFQRHVQADVAAGRGSRRGEGLRGVGRRSSGWVAPTPPTRSHE